MEAVAEQIKSIFQAADINQDGKLSRDELKRTLCACGSWTDAEVAELFQRANVNDDGFLDYREFVDWVLAPRDKWANQEAGWAKKEDQAAQVIQTLFAQVIQNLLRNSGKDAATGNSSERSKPDDSTGPLRPKAAQSPVEGAVGEAEVSANAEEKLVGETEIAANAEEKFKPQEPPAEEVTAEKTVEVVVTTTGEVSVGAQIIAVAPELEDRDILFGTRGVVVQDHGDGTVRVAWQTPDDASTNCSKKWVCTVVGPPKAQTAANPNLKPSPYPKSVGVASHRMPSQERQSSKAHAALVAEPPLKDILSELNELRNK